MAVKLSRAGDGNGSHRNGQSRRWSELLGFGSRIRYALAYVAVSFVGYTSRESARARKRGKRTIAAIDAATERPTPLAEHLTISLDAMGGDNGPEMVIAGVELASERHPDVRFILFGDEATLEPLVAARPSLQRCCEVRHASDVVDPDDKPSQTVRRGRDTSMWQAIMLVKERGADAVVSAGNTGALLAMSVIQLRTMESIDRPAIASTWPGLERESVVLDLGANLECSQDNLVQFAIMGAAFARVVMGVPRPKVGLLNVGEEEQKGHESVREAARKLRIAPQDDMEFIGFVEGNDLGFGVADVIVTDGFSGNVALKTGEGSARLIFQTLADGFRGSIRGKIAYLLARGVLGHLRDKFDPRAHNGGVFLGLNGIVIKSHGGTDDVGFAHAIDMSIDMARGGLEKRILDDMTNFSQALEVSTDIAGESKPVVANAGGST